MTSKISGQWISCNAPYGSGGLGLHLASLVERARSMGHLAGYFCTRGALGDEAITVSISNRLTDSLARYTPIRISPGWKNFTHVDIFDRSVAARMQCAPESFIAFVGQALHSFRKTRAMGTRYLELIAANSHVQNVRQRHQEALRRYPYESSWLNEAQIKKTLLEYREADCIQVATDYTLASFLERGFPATRLVKVPLHVDSRFGPRDVPVDDGIFRIVYVGALTVAKGVPLLIDAFKKLSIRRSQLILVGGWATSGMKNYLQRTFANDERIKILPGDPLPQLQQASVYVHASYEDGFGYAPMEALACGVPVIVSADTGMKEWIRTDATGYVFPTGNLDALVDRLQAVYKTIN